MGFFAALLIWLMSALMSALVAGDKGHSGTLWGLIGLFAGPLGVVGAAGLSDRKLHGYLQFLAEEKGFSRRNDGTHDPIAYANELLRQKERR